MPETGYPIPRWQAFDDRAGAARALAQRIADDLEQALDANERAALVVSGGSSPIGFLRRLCSAELDWPRISIVPSDERRVPAGHADRNERMIRAELLRGPAVAASLVSLIDAPDALRATLERLLPFAAVVLGMGEDGHTASLFPNAPDIGGALSSPELCLSQQVPGLSSGRISLTPRALLDSGRIYMLLFGENKRIVYEQALEPGPFAALPVRAVLHQTRVPVEAFWAE